MKSTPLMTAMIFAAAASIAAQTQAQGKADGKAGGPGAAVTIRGCVTRADLSYANGVKGTDGRAVTSGGTSDKFLLANARRSDGTESKKDDSRAAQTSNSDPLALKGPYYLLEGQSADMRQHLGHEVEITGTLEQLQPDPALANGNNARERERSASSPSSGQTGTAGSGTAGSTDSANLVVDGPQLRVQSVRMVASTCSVQ